MEIDKINNNNNNNSNGNKRKQLEINDNNDPDNRKLTKIETNNNDNNDGNNNDNNDNNDNKTTKIPDEIVTKDGHLYYVCRYCNKVFRIKKERTVHLRKCPAKSYILTIADNYNNNNNNNNNNDNNSEQDNNIDDIEKAKKTDAFDRLLASKTNEIYLNNGKINVKQNIVLNKKTKSKMAVKITIPRSPTTDNTTSTTIITTTNGNNDNTVITTDNNDDKDEETIATKDNTIDNNDNMVKVLCRHCKLTFNNGIELLRHRRELHKYPKIIMAMSEIKKLYYDIKDWTKCPICTKPLHNNYRSTYLRHLNTHANEFDYIKCRICEKKFRRFDHMKDHEKRHIIEDKRQ